MKREGDPPATGRPSFVPGPVTAQPADNPELRRLTEAHAQLGQEFDDLRRRHIELVARDAWALAVATELARRPRGLAGFLAQLLPHGLWCWFQERRLLRKGLFDVRAYRNRYPDTARSKLVPLAHFLRWGINEGRSGGPNRTTAPGQEIGAETVAAILRSGLFDRQWYCARHGLPEVSAEEAVRAYLVESAGDPLHDPGPLFSNAHYLLENPDVQGENPLIHYLDRGLADGRRALAPDRADAFMAGAADVPLNRIDELIDPARKTLVLCWKDGNFFFEDIAGYLCEYLANRGHVVERSYDDAGVELASHNLVVVAPHEYCIHGPGRHWPADRFAQAVSVNTEQWHTSWFSLALGVMMRSRKALDINPASARGLCKLGIATAFLPIHPAEGPTFAFPRAPLSPQTASPRWVKPLTYPDRFADRPYDILYVAALNDRRARVLAGLASRLAQYDCFLHTPLLQGPVTARSANMIPSADLAQLARNSRILLNIHQGRSGYFEWHRLFVSGIHEGCVVVTEPCVDTGIFVAGRHYLEVEAGAMGPYLDWLLGTDAGQHKMAEVHAACAVFRNGAASLEPAP